MAFDFFDLLPQPAWVYDVHTLRFIAVNAMAVNVYGYSIDEFAQMTLLDIRPSEDYPSLVSDIASSGDSIQDSGIWRHRKKDGSVFDVRIISKSIDHEGIAARIVIATEATQSYLEDRLKVALAAGKLAIWEYNIADGTLLWDPLETGSYGDDRAQFPRTHDEFLLMVEPEFRAQLNDAFKRCIETGEDYSFEFRMRMPSGKIRWRHAFGKRVADHGGVAVKIIGVGLDTTELRQFEQKLAQSQKLQAIGRLAGGVAHDLNNILTVVTSHCELTQQIYSLDKVRESIAEIDLAAKKGADIIRQLVGYSNAQEYSPRPIDLNQAVRETIQMIKLLLPKSIALFMILDANSLSIQADTGHIEQILMNLCLNAKDAISGNGKIAITTRRVTKSGETAHAELIVADSGAGMDITTQQQMFEPFFTTKSRELGLGLGMSIVQDVVDQLGGLIDVESEKNVGTTITIQLPMLPGH